MTGVLSGQQVVKMSLGKIKLFAEAHVSKPVLYEVKAPFTVIYFSQDLKDA